jgi:hypothetical protein
MILPDRAFLHEDILPNIRGPFARDGGPAGGVRLSADHAGGWDYIFS